MENQLIAHQILNQDNLHREGRLSTKCPWVNLILKSILIREGNELKKFIK